MPEWLKKEYEGINKGIDASKKKDQEFWKAHPDAHTVKVNIVHKDYNVTPKNEADLKAVSDALKGTISSVQLNKAGGVIGVVSPTPNKIPKFQGIAVYEEKSWIKRMLKKILETIRALLGKIQR